MQAKKYRRVATAVEGYLVFSELCGEHDDRNSQQDNRVSDHPPKVGKDSRVVAGYSGSAGVDRVRKRQNIGYCFEHAADHRRIEPDVREPRRKVRQQRAAYAADRLVAQQGTEQQSQRDKHQRDRDIDNNRKKQINADSQSKAQRREITDRRLNQRHRNQRQSVAEDKVRRLQR